MRCDQPHGLPERARAFLLENAKLIKTKECPHCGHELERGYSRRVCGSFFGMGEVSYPLFEYDLKNGSIVKETQQCCPWSSGPMVFLKLTDKKGNDMIKWTATEINEAAGEEVFSPGDCVDDSEISDEEE